ncbi:MAG TPA: dihydroorotase family protein [Candidatus Dormibacteraeota bacterium]|nr:dihydroorotase family protein [Candidatus Dormibacteraeota bacterium]
MRLRVAGDILVAPHGRRAADLVAEDGTGTRLGEPGRAGPADEEIDAFGRLVLPGFIDPYVHRQGPGTPEEEGLVHATLAAVWGGVTTIFDILNTVPPLDVAHPVVARGTMYQGQAWADFGLRGHALDRERRELVYETAGRSPESLLPLHDTAEVQDLLREVAAADGLLAVHGEERGALDSVARRLEGPVRDEADLLAAHPDTAEAATIALLAETASGTGRRPHVVYLSSARGLRAVRQAQAAGITVPGEACRRYLTLTEADDPCPGSRLEVFPLVRTAADREASWAGTADGTITSVGCDHASHLREQEERSPAEAPAGAIGVETLPPVPLGAMTAGRISRERRCRVLAEGTARPCRVYPWKGALRPGSDGDLTIVDPEAEWRTDEGRLHSSHRLSPRHGRCGRGCPRLTALRGEVVGREGKPVVEPRGRPLEPRPGGRTG